LAVGFVLINVSPGSERQVFNTLMKNERIEELHPLFGEYDLIAKITVKDFEDLTDVVVNYIRTLPGVVDTKTLTGAKF
jgi:DNA-binding Lrp family transcriptional regulator